MFNLMTVLTLGLVVLIIDIAAIMDLTQNVEPNYAMEIGFLAFSLVFFAILPKIYKKMKAKEESQKPKGRF